MKKIIAFTLIVLVLTSMIACTSNDNKQPSDDTTTTTTVAVDDENVDDSTSIDISVFPELKTSTSNLSVYREEVEKRLASMKDGDSFIRDDEWNAIAKYWNGSISQNSYGFVNSSNSKYYFPVVYKDGTNLILWYTTDYGTVLVDDLVGRLPGGNSYGQLHIDSYNGERMDNNHEYTLLFETESAKAKIYKFNQIVAEYQLPENSVYCGSSYFVGYIFRSGTDVYALRDGEVVCIADNVSYVIDSDYYLESDLWCQPLFLMVDGSIKAYNHWESVSESPDSDSRLVDLMFEGGWDKGNGRN